jgi:methylamine dehydrogenase accessory protein MauD
MDVALLIARVLLAGVFGVAGLAKLTDAEGSRQGMRDVGVPAALVGPFALLLPLAELVVAVLLLPVATAWWGALGALALLVLFLAGIGVSLARGRRPACRCFGQLSAKPIGAETVVRNVLLAAVAVFVLLPGPGNGGASVFGWLGDLTVAERVGLGLAVLALLLVAGTVWLLLQIMQQQGRLLLRLDAVEARLDGRYVGADGPLHEHGPAHVEQHGQGPPMGLPIGAPAPDLDLPDLEGERWSLDRLLAPGTPTMLLFVDPGCGPCASLLPDVETWQGEHADILSVALISRGTAEENRQKVAGRGLGPVLLQNDFEVADAYQVSGTPFAVLVDSSGGIASQPVGGPDAIRALVARTLQPADAPHAHANGHLHHPEPGLPLGAPAPEIELADLDGRPFSLAEQRGQKTLVLFWNPGCGFCQQMLPDLKAWEDDPPPRSPELLVIAAGTAEANRQFGLRSTVLLDSTASVSQAYQAGGTPMAVLVDGQGRIASTLVAGAPGVLALAGARPRTTAP